MKDFIYKAKKIIEEIPYITIASITENGEPWNTPVFAVHDKNYNFYWNSHQDSQHSKNITLHKKIFLVIYDSSVSAGEGFGVYIQAEAKELGEGIELEEALRTFYNKKNTEPKPQTDFLTPNFQRFYKATPVTCWVNAYDKNHIPSDWKEEINLK